MIRIPTTVVICVLSSKVFFLLLIHERGEFVPKKLPVDYITWLNEKSYPYKACCRCLMYRYRDIGIRLLIFGFQVNFLSMLVSFQHFRGIFYK